MLAQLIAGSERRSRKRNAFATLGPCNRDPRMEAAGSLLRCQSSSMTARLSAQWLAHSGHEAVE
jgi:hypothetical protein